MCGFVACLDLSGGGVGNRYINRMTDVIWHRGPDDSGYVRQDNVSFGFRRLSIQDLSEHGHQPMSLAEAGVTIVFNGEIYNFVELRSELERRGRRFRSTGDTEVLLHAYLEWGAGCLDRLNGMWAFVIYDAKRKVLFGARDRFGIKPLYRYANAGAVVLCSEIKSIRVVPDFPLTPNWRTSAAFLLEGRLDDTEDTFYREVRQVRAGHAFEIGLDGAYHEWRYWQPDAAESGSFSDPPGEYAELFEEAVRLHMRSDVPVGVHLSGGLDSTSIICASARIRRSTRAQGPLMAFSFGTPEFDETRYIRDTLDQTGASFVPLDGISEDLWQSIQQCLWHQDEPVHTMIAVIGFLLMRLTAKHGIKVILNGQGADETIGGYPSYFRDYWQMLLARGEWYRAWHEIGQYTAVHGGSVPGRFLGELRNFGQQRAGWMPGYKRLTAARRARALVQHPWFRPEFAEALGAFDTESPPASLHDSLQQSVSQAPLPIFLRVEDRNSMAHSVEARVPFLDVRLVSMARCLKAQWLLRGPLNKFILREAMRGRIPESVRTRGDKMGFPLPTRRWLPGVLYEPFMDVITSAEAKARGIYRVEAIERDMARHIRGEIDVMHRLFDVVQFELWNRLPAVDESMLAKRAASVVSLRPGVVCA